MLTSKGSATLWAGYKVAVERGNRLLSRATATISGKKARAGTKIQFPCPLITLSTLTKLILRAVAWCAVDKGTPGESLLKLEQLP